MDWPTCRVAGKDAPETANPVPARFTEFIVIAAVPDAVRLSDLLDFVFTGTVPKARVVPLTLNWTVCGEDLTTYPAQPERPDTRHGVAEKNNIGQLSTEDPEDKLPILRCPRRRHARLMVATRDTTRLNVQIGRFSTGRSLKSQFQGA